MNSKFLFLLGCIPTRLLLVFISYYALNTDSKYLKYILSIITFIIGISFIIIYKKGWRKTGLETGGKEIWWNNYRPIHGSIYITFSILSIINIIKPSNNLKYIWILLLLDIIVGLFAFSKNYNYI
jgi:hypothetical protein